MVTEERLPDVRRDEPVVVQVKFRPRMLSQVRALADREGNTASDVIRRAVSRLLREELGPDQDT